MDYKSLRERTLRLISDLVAQQPNELRAVDNLLDGLVRVLKGFKPGPVYGFLSKEAPKPKEVNLPVPFWKQTDNYRDGNRTCFSSSMAMVVEFLAPEKLKGDDEYVKTVFSIGDTTDPTVQVKALAKHGIEGTYRQNMDFADLDKELAGGFPVGIGILHRGPSDAPTGGHWIVVKGKTSDGLAYYCNDPYGSIGDGYQGDAENGNNVQYSVNMLRKRWTADGAGSGWGMTCRKKP